MKRTILAIILLLCTALTSVCEDRTEVLKVYDWENCVSDRTIELFQEYYRQYTGKEIRVHLQLMDNDLTAISQIASSHDDWDVITLSNLSLSKYIHTGVISPIDRSVIQKYGAPDYLSNLSPFLREKIAGLDENLDYNKYFVPFTLSSLGFLYNTDRYSKADLSTWGILRDPRFKGKILFSSDAQDLYCAALCDIHRDELLSGEMTHADLFREITDERLAEVEKWSREASGQIAGWDTGFGYDYIIQCKIPIIACWVTDAQLIIDISEEEGGAPLDFVIPDEGSYFFCDGLVIPAYAGNPEAAVLWINFKLSPLAQIADVSTGPINFVVSDTLVLEALQNRDKYPVPVDLSYHFPDCPEKARQVYVSNALYIDAGKIDRFSFCGDFSNKLEDLIMLHSRIQVQDFRPVEFWPEIILCLILLAVFIIRLFRS